MNQYDCFVDAVSLSKMIYLSMNGAQQKRSMDGNNFPDKVIHRCHKTWRPRQNGSNFAYDIIKFIFMYGGCFVILISQKCVPMGPMNNQPVFVKIMARHQTGNPLSESLTAYFTNAYIYLRHSAAMSWYTVMWKFVAGNFPQLHISWFIKGWWGTWRGGMGTPWYRHMLFTIW